MHISVVVPAAIPMNIASLQEKRISELQAIAQDLGMAEFADWSKRDLIYRILEAYAETVPVGVDSEEPWFAPRNGQSHRGEDHHTGRYSENNTENGMVRARPPAYMLDFDPKRVTLAGMIRKVGVLEVLPDGYGFLRSPEYRYHPSADDIYVSPSQIKRFSLRVGDTVEGEIRPPREGQRFFALIHVGAINGRPPEASGERIGFENLPPGYTDTSYRLETSADAHAPRILDLLYPIGVGHRTLVVAPPRSGRTTLLQQIARSLSANYPEAHVLALLINEQSDDIVEFEWHTKADVVATMFGDPPERHVHMATLASEKARRMVEAGHDVVLLLDSITELVRAHNVLAQEGHAPAIEVLDEDASRAPKALFGAARTVVEGGSLTIVATIQVDTDSDLDEMIYQEFKAAPNTTLSLSSELAWNRIYPAIDLHRSHTRREEVLIPADHLQSTGKLRRRLLEQEPMAAMKSLIERLGATRSNADLVASLSTDD